MQLIGGFYKFAERVIGAVKAGKGEPEDVKKLERLLERTGKRNLVLAKGILSALTSGGASDQEVSQFAQLLEKANDRISKNKEPFTDSDKKTILEIFQNHDVSKKAASWFANQLDELVAEEIEEHIQGGKSIIPAKKTVTLESSKTSEQNKEKLKRV